MNFEMTYIRYKRTILAISKRYNRTTGIPIPDFVSALNEALWKAWSTYSASEGRTFNTWVQTLLKQSAINVVKSKEGTYYKRQISILDATPNSEEEDEPRLLIEKSKCQDQNNDNDFIATHKKKEAQQRQLLNFLLESAKIQNDPTMTAIIEGLPRYETVMALAKALGLQRNTVDRKLRRLARHYNPEIHGDILDYFPDGVRIKREFLTA